MLLQLSSFISKKSFETDFNEPVIILFIYSVKLYLSDTGCGVYAYRRTSA